MSARITAAEATTILRDLARGREDGNGGDVWPLYERAEDAMAAVVALDDELATAQSHATHALDDAATQRARAEAAEAEVARLRAERDESEGQCMELREAMRRQAAAVMQSRVARATIDAHDQATLRSLAGQDRAALIEELAAARRERDDWNARATALESERDEALAATAGQWRRVSEDTAFAPPFSTIRVCRHCGCRCAESPTGGA